MSCYFYHILNLICKDATLSIIGEHIFELSIVVKTDCAGGKFHPLGNINIRLHFLVNPSNRFDTRTKLRDVAVCRNAFYKLKACSVKRTPDVWFNSSSCWTGMLSEEIKPGTANRCHYLGLIMLTVSLPRLFPAWSPQPVTHSICPQSVRQAIYPVCTNSSFSPIFKWPGFVLAHCGSRFSRGGHFHLVVSLCCRRSQGGCSSPCQAWVNHRGLRLAVLPQFSVPLLESADII